MVDRRSIGIIDFKVNQSGVYCMKEIIRDHLKFLRTENANVKNNVGFNTNFEM